MSIKLKHLHSAWDVDRFIVLEDKKLVVVRFSNNERLKYRTVAGETTQSTAATSKRNREHDNNDRQESSDSDSNENPKNNTKKRNKKKDKDKEGNTGDTSTTTQLLNYEHNVATQRVDEMLVAVAQAVVKFCTIYAVDTDEVGDFNELYELHDPDDPFALMFFYQNKHVKIDLGTGNNNKINFVLSSTAELIDIIEKCVLAGKEKTFFVSDVSRKYPNAKSKRDL